MTQSEVFDVRYRLLSSLPEDLVVGETLLLDVEITNTGTTDLDPAMPHPVRLSYHLHDSRGKPVVEDGRRTELPGIVSPGDRVRLELEVTSPPQAGDYVLQIELVKEQVCWFSERNIRPLAARIHYATPSGPLACVINGNVTALDAVGNEVVAHLHALRAAGYHALVLTEAVDPRLPREVRRFMTPLLLAELREPNERTQGVVDHFRSADITVVHYSTYYELAHAIELVRHGAVLFDYHGITPPELWTGDLQGFRDLALGREHLSLVKYADHAIAHSSFTRSELLATGLIGAERAHVIPLGVVDKSQYAATRDPALVEKYGLAGKRILLYVGRMARNKRISDLVEALALVRQQHPNTVLLLVGDNQWKPFRDYADEAQQLAETLGCAEDVIWTGQVPDLEPYYRSCDLFVTASIHEGFGAPVIEAMAHGKPVVVTAAAALPETVGDAGLLFEPQNPRDLATKIARLLDDLPPLNGQAPTAPAEPEIVFPPEESGKMWGGRTIALVAPRYGLEILGGAERMLRGWAEELARRGYRTEVLTTCTASMSDWSNYYKPGVEQINGVTVRRFATDHIHGGIFHGVLGKAAQGRYVSYHDEQEFMRNNLQSSALNQYLRDHAEDYVCAVFGPYLFGTTYWGMQALPDKAIILPCLHDEPAAKLTVFREMLEGAAGIFFNAPAECELAVQKLGIANPNRSVVGYGFDLHAPRGNGAAFRARRNLPEEILLYSGRLEAPKNVPLLLDFFVRYKTEHPGPLTLVLTGTGDVRIPRRPDIVALGFLPDDSDDLRDAYAAATVLCQPSVNESFSIVMMRSWIEGRPVLMHADCAVTSDFVRKSGGGYIFGDYPTFRTALRRLFSNPAHAAELGQRGRAYVERHYTWDIVTDRFAQGVAAFTEERSLYSRLSQHGIHRSLEFTRRRVDDALLQLVDKARSELGVGLSPHLQRQLRQMAQVGMPGYTVRSGLPVVGRLIAWGRRQLTSHLREPYLDPMIERQETFNNELLRTLVPMLEQSLHEQRRLGREVEALRAQLARGTKADESTAAQVSTATASDDTGGQAS